MPRVNYGHFVDRLERLWGILALPLMPDGLPDLIPALLLIVAGAAVVAVMVGDRIGVGVFRTYGWLVCLMVPVAYTLTAATGPGIVGCELGVLPWESRGALVSPETTSNILLFVPAGAATILFPSGARRLAALATVLALPVTIEMGQMITRTLGRACQISDVVNNEVGVLLGLWLASGVWVVCSSLRSVAYGRATANSAGDSCELADRRSDR